VSQQRGRLSWRLLFHFKMSLSFSLPSLVSQNPISARIWESAYLRADIQKRYSKAWGDLADQMKMADLAFHNLRHIHASQLTDAGVDIVTISKRLGYSKPDITLRIYAHLFRKDDGEAAAAANAALNG
jgi:integrase